MPTVPPSGSRSSRVSNARSLPSARRRPSAPRSRVATPAESYPLYSRRLSASTSCPATGLVPKIPTIPHIRLDGPFAQPVWFSLRRQAQGNHNAFRHVTSGCVMGRQSLFLRLLSGQGLAQRLHLSQAFCPAFLNCLFDARDSQRTSWNILGYYRPGANVSAIADLDRRDQRGIRTDEGTFADIGAVLGDAIIIAGDGAGANIGSLAHTRIADIGEMIGLGASLDPRLFHLNEISDVHILAKVGARAQPRERSDARSFADMGAFKVRECADRCAVLNGDARAKHDVRLDGYVFSEFGICRQIYSLRRDHGDACVEGRQPQALLQHRFRFSELHLGVDAAHVILRGFDRYCLQSHIAGDGNGVGEIIFALGIRIPYTREDGEGLFAGERHEAAIAEANLTLFVRGVALLPDRSKFVALHDQPPVSCGIGRLEPEHRHGRAFGQCTAQLRKGLGPYQWRVREHHQDIIRTAGDRLACRQDSVGGPRALALLKDLYLGCAFT